MDLFLEIFEQVRRRYEFEVMGFVVMPEHIHLPIIQPERDSIPIVVQVLKQRVAHRLLSKSKPGGQGELWESGLRRRVWQRRYYDLNVYSDGKVTEKLRYMHRNPVERGLACAPELWRWSSYRTFAGLEEGIVRLNWQRRPAGKKSRAEGQNAVRSLASPPSERRGG